MKDKFNSKVIGLDAGLLIGKFFMDTEELHYGYGQMIEQQLLLIFLKLKIDTHN